MNKDDLLRLTNNLYRLTLFFPKKEPLRYKMREIADDVLASSLRITNYYESPNNKNLQGSDPCNLILEDLTVLDGFFEVAKNQNWVSPNDILKLKEEYIKLGEEFKKLKIKEKRQVENLRQEMMPIRQQKILEILKEKERVQVWEIKKIFPEVSKRTLRRDFNNLLKRGIIERIGEKNVTFYKLK